VDNNSQVEIYKDIETNKGQFDQCTELSITLAE